MTRRAETLRKRREQAQRRNNLLLLGIVAGVVLVIAAIFAWQQVRPIGDITAPPEATYYQFAQGKTLGPADARVVIQEFADFQCPACATFTQSVAPLLKSTYIEAGASVRIEFYHYPIVDRIVQNGTTESFRSGQAGECAADQNRFWQFHDYMYYNQQGEGRGGFRDARIRAIAEAAGLDMPAFDACFASSASAEGVRADEALGNQLGVQGTPTLFINGQRVQNFADFGEFQTRIDALLAGAP
jgi:protein-disulfide isomerase